MKASDYLENAILDHINGKATWNPPATYYLALCTVLPVDADTGSTITEANYTGYSRKSYVSADLNAASGGAADNANEITFDPCTGGTSTVVGFAICDAASAGNVLLHGTASLSVSNGVTPRVPAGQLDITCD